MATHTVKDLQVWQRAIALTTQVYLICKQLPIQEQYALTNQMQRAAVSVPSNIAEGQKRINKKEFIQFLGVALGSLAELETQLILAMDLYDIDTSMEQKECHDLSNMMTALAHKLRTQNSELRTVNEVAV